MYGILLLIALSACIFAIRYANLEIKLATTLIGKKHQRKVRRRLPKKQNKTTNKKRNIKPDPITESTDENIESLKPQDDAVTQQSESTK